MSKTCLNCEHMKVISRYGGLLRLPACRAQAGKKWPINAAQKESRCGTKKVWWSKKEQS